LKRRSFLQSLFGLGVGATVAVVLPKPKPEEEREEINFYCGSGIFTPVTADEIFETGMVYSPYIPLHVTRGV
jgi:hypothetical protein